MPSNKPQLKTNIDENIKIEFEKIAAEQKRSASNLLNVIITEYVENYEKQRSKFITENMRTLAIEQMKNQKLIQEKKQN